MSVQTVAGKFKQLVNQGKHFEVMRTMYAPEMVSVEADGKEYVGKDVVIHKSEVFQGNNDILSQDVRGPFFLGDPKANAAHVEQLFRWWAEGKIAPKVSATYPLERAGEAIAELRDRHAIGKLVVMLTD